MLKKRNSSGMTLLETLIGSVIFIIVLGIMTSFTFRFTNYSNRLTVQNDLAESLRLTNLRMIKEIEECSAVLPSYTAPDSTYGTALDGSTTFVTTTTTAGSVMVLTRRVVDQTTYRPYSTDSQNTNLNDVIIIKYDSATGKMIFSLIPATGQTTPTNINIPTNYRSTAIMKSVLTSNLIKSASYNPFTYYDYGSNPVTLSNLPNASLVVSQLSGTATYGDYIVNKNTEERINLRNFSK